MAATIRKFAISLIVVGLISTIHHSQTPLNGSLTVSTSPAIIPVPVCPPNDPNACHIDQWGK